MAERAAGSLGLKTVIESENVDILTPGHKLYLGYIGAEGAGISVHLTSPTDRGFEQFSTEITLLLSVLKPEFALHIGTCAADVGGGR